MTGCLLAPIAWLIGFLAHPIEFVRNLIRSRHQDGSEDDRGQPG